MIVRLGRKGSLTLPKALREGLDENIPIEAVRRDGGVIELRPVNLEGRDPDQWWFWTEKWQRMEREADEDIAAGRVHHFDDMESFFAHLDSLPPAADE